MHGLSSGYRVLHMDQGGDLWKIQSIRNIYMKAGYSLEPTGSDAASGNGKVENMNGTFAAIV